MTGIMALLVVSKEKRTLPYNFSPLVCAVLLTTLVVKGTAPSPLALSAGNDRVPPSILFHTMFSVEKLRADDRLYRSYASMSPFQKSVGKSPSDVYEPLV